MIFKSGGRRVVVKCLGREFPVFRFPQLHSSGDSGDGNDNGGNGNSVCLCVADGSQGVRQVCIFFAQ